MYSGSGSCSFSQLFVTCIQVNLGISCVEIKLNYLAKITRWIFTQIVNFLRRFSLKTYHCSTIQPQQFIPINCAPRMPWILLRGHLLDIFFILLKPFKDFLWLTHPEDCSNLLHWLWCVEPSFLKDHLHNFSWWISNTQLCHNFIMTLTTKKLVEQNI